VVWKKWIDLYNAKRMAEGNFLNLYTLGYDTPEGYAIEKDGKMFYAFFLPEHSAPWKGELELRGLKPGQYKVFDYVNNKDLGSVGADKPRLATQFVDRLLLEATSQ
jgi:alpha-galactosidase